MTFIYIFLLLILIFLLQIEVKQLEKRFEDFEAFLLLDEEWLENEVGDK